MPLRVEIVRDAGALHALESAWWDLWRRCPPATPFQSPAWLLPWWRSFAPGELASITVWSGERLAALAPFYLERGESGTRMLPIGIGVSDYLDVLVDPAHPEAGAALVRAADADWDAWSLEELPPEAAALGLPLPPGLEADEGPQSACPVLTLAGSGVAADPLPPKMRRQLRHDWARARRRGRVEIMRATGADEFLDVLLRLHEARWRSRGGGVLDDPTVRAFHRETLPALAAHGLARTYTLAVDGTAAGAYYGFSDGRRACYYIGGFDPEFADISPGVLLIGHAIEEARREGAAEFHFLRGREPYKYAWGAADRWNRKRVLRRSASGFSR